MTSSITSVPFVIANGKPADASQLQTNFSKIVSDVNSQVLPKVVGTPVISALPFPTLSTTAKAAEVQANFDHIAAQVNANARGLAAPIVPALPYSFMDGTPGNGSKVQANFDALVRDINNNALPDFGNITISVDVTGAHFTSAAILLPERYILVGGTVTRGAGLLAPPPDENPPATIGPFDQTMGPPTAYALNTGMEPFSTVFTPSPFPASLPWDHVQSLVVKYDGDVPDFLTNVTVQFHRVDHSIG